MNEWKQSMELIRDDKSKQSGPGKTGRHEEQLGIKHLMIPLAAFVYGDWYSILSPCADASLHDLFEHNEKGQMLEEFTSREFWTQMNGLVSALHFIHYEND